jgi:putative tryptophan/tyrosine transport system substrate-binding protein
MPMVGVIHPGAAKSDAWRMTAFRQGLNETGYVEGQSVVVEFRWAESQYHLMPDLVVDLLRRRVSVIATLGSALAALAAKAATTEVPIVASLAQPGGNVTGVNFLNTELATKQLGLARELVPGATRVAVLINPANITAEPT